MTPEQIAAITKHYAFTPDDKSALTGLLASAYLHAKQAAYQRAHTTAGHRVSLPVWRPGDADATTAHQWASRRVEGIAETYETLLRDHLKQLPEDETQEALVDILRGAKGIVKKIADWFSQFLPWKTEQIAQDTVNEGDNDGTEQFVDDVRNGGTDYSMLRVRVLPETSSDDTCADFAGRDFPFDSVGTEVPEFPIHSHCPHYLYVYAVDADGNEVEVSM